MGVADQYRVLLFKDPGEISSRGARAVEHRVVCVDQAEQELHPSQTDLLKEVRPRLQLLTLISDT